MDTEVNLDWYLCDEDGGKKSLDLSENGSNDSTMLSVFNLAKPHAADITSINLSRSGVTHIPASIGQFVNLRSLICYCTHISKLPPEFYELKKLVEVRFENCDLEEISSEIAKLAKLNVLVLSGNKNLRDLPKEIASMPELRTFQAHNCESLPSELAGQNVMQALRDM